MSLSAGARLGAFEILGPLGAGGMGEVYRAHDTTLGRDVAIKVLTPAFARNPEGLGRFQREARILASLNHPGIAAIHGLESSGGAPALVMELVEGPTLADRIRQGPIPLEDALTIARQMAEALEYAHERGIVHRDLKPANVKLTGDDRVKILDLGLAKALDAEVSTAEGSTPVMSNSPTLSHIATQAGVLLGTAAYMSPEQARGKPVDRRADVWAFGCVLFEMLTGRIAFLGETVTDTLAAVVGREPDWALLPAATPPPVRSLLVRCLRKEARQRLQAVGDARIELEDVLSGGQSSGAPAGSARSRKPSLASALAGALVVAVVAGVGAWSLRPSSEAPRPVTRFAITLPPGQQLAALDLPAIALSADGSQLAYVATAEAGGPPRIYLREMDGLAPRPLPGTEGAAGPFFSPDGQWLGFFSGGKLEKISVRGGVARSLADVGGYARGASWSSRHTIAFAPYSSGLQAVADAGGIPHSLTRFGPDESLHLWPQFLPGGDAVLFTALSSGETRIAVQRVGDGERRDLVRGQGGYMPCYASSGQLVFAQDGNLMAAPLDLRHLKVTGEAVPVLQAVLQEQAGGAAQYSVSATGTLAYVSGSPPSAKSRLVWVGRDGTEQMLDAPARNYNQPRLSPDGRRVAVDVVESTENMQVWLYDIALDRLAPFTFGGVNRHAVWTPDGKRIAFMSNREGATQVFSQRADGNGGLERLTDNPRTATADVLTIPYSWSPDGHQLILVRLAPTTGAELWALPVGGAAGPAPAGEARLLLKTQTMDGGPELSPDGRWLAYASEESGRREIYVQAYPGPGGKWQVSTDGGNEPRWNPNGRELFYCRGDDMMAVDIGGGAGVTAGKPRRLFAGHYTRTGGGYVRANYDVSPDGRRFLMLKPVEQEQAPPTEIDVVLNWSEELKRLVPSTSR